jgi:hypothetical protein
MKKSLFISEPLDSDDEEEERETNYEKKDPLMPNLGTRVKRGPDWQWKNQDGHSPGTVTGYSNRGTNTVASIAYYQINKGCLVLLVTRFYLWYVLGTVFTLILLVT